MGVLSSLHVLDFSGLLPGPFASMMLADLGADVVRVEAPGHTDLVRLFPPFDRGTSTAHAYVNRSKRSIALDLKRPGAAAIVKRLVSKYDIVLEQFRPGAMERLGVGYSTLSEANPRLIYCALTGYGQTGPLRDRAGHDNNYLALAGAMSHSGRREAGPVPQGILSADLGGSFCALTGILSAVIHRQETGRGQYIDVSMFDGALTWNVFAAAEALAGGTCPTYESTVTNGGTHYDYYRTRDGRYLSVGCLEPKFWKEFCQAIERPDLEGRQGWPGPEMAQVKEEIRSVIAQKTAEEWQTVFAGKDVCVEPVLTLPEALNHSQTRARDMVVEVPVPGGGTQRQLGCPIKFSSARPDYRHTGVEAGAHTGEILRELGYSEEEIETLQEEGLFGAGGHQE